MRWTKERAWEWYNGRPWLRGCNYVPATCANYVDIWQEYNSEETYKTMEEEIALLKKTGYNTVRIILAFVVWQKEHDGFMERFERFLTLLDKHGVTAMVVLANDCMPPKNEHWKLPDVGPQEFAIGYHGGKKRGQHSRHPGASPHYYLDEPETRAEYYEMVRELVTKYKHDHRICIWDVYNEPGHSNRDELTPDRIREMFELVRSIDPDQPLTACVHRIREDDTVPLSEVEQYALDNSDIISYHCYRGYEAHVRVIRRLLKEGRPIVNTEWLCRGRGDDFFSLFPLFYLNRIGCYNWGFVAGKTQTYEPWELIWDDYEAGIRYHDYDFTKWFHDVYRPSHHPYDPKEIKIIQLYSELADREFARDGHL